MVVLVAAVRVQLDLAARRVRLSGRFEQWRARCGVPWHPHDVAPLLGAYRDAHPLCGLEQRLTARRLRRSRLARVQPVRELLLLGPRQAPQHEAAGQLSVGHLRAARDVAGDVARRVGVSAGVGVGGCAGIVFSNAHEQQRPQRPAVKRRLAQHEGHLARRRVERAAARQRRRAAGGRRARETAQVTQRWEHVDNLDEISHDARARAAVAASSAVGTRHAYPERDARVNVEHL